LPAVLLPAALVLAGCGSPSGAPSDGASATTTTEGSTIEVGTASLPPTTPPAPALPETSNDLVAYIMAASQVDFSKYTNDGVTPSFTTPSGNISCGLFEEERLVSCFIEENSWPAVSAQACEDGEWTDVGVRASASGVERGGCYSEQPFLYPATALPYGATISDTFTACRSESAFLACVNLSSGNGFVIAKTIYHTYGTVVS
jgi:hypothetical protein